MLPIFKPTVLIFDLDETVHSFYKIDRVTSNIIYANTSLSSSAENLRCEEPIGHFNHDGPYHLQAIALEKFKEIFDSIYKIHNLYQKNSPIAVKIITRGDYEEDEIKNAWDKFYGDGDKRFTTGLFPLEIFNRYSFKKNGVPVDLDADSCEFKKEELIAQEYPRWEKQLPGLEKRRVIIIDDIYETTVKVKEAGFSAIHFPTNKHSRPIGVTFTKDGSKAFAAIHELIATAVSNLKFKEEEDITLSESEEEDPFSSHWKIECCIT